MVVGGHCARDGNSIYTGETFNMKDCINEFQSCKEKGNWEYKENMLLGVGGFNGGSYVTYNDSRGFFMIGSEADTVNTENDLSDKLVHFNESTNSFGKLHLHLNHSRYGHSAVIIPDGDQ